MIRKSLVAALFLLAACSVKAAEDWQDPAVFERNRLPMASSFVTDQQKTISLEGMWAFNFCESPSARTMGFEAVGFDDSSWGEIPVPGLWELCGYCDPMYLNIGYPWRGHYKNKPPIVPEEHNYVGQYRRKVFVDSDWKGKQICIFIGSATSNIRIWVNGKEVGYSQDSKLEARFDITKFVTPGAENTIAFEIFRWCDGTYMEDQDFWRFSGIARGAYLYTREPKRLENVRIKADSDGQVHLYAEVSKGITEIDFESVSPDGSVTETHKYEGGFKKGEGSLMVFKNDYKATGKVKLWTAETPNLYTMKVSVKDKAGVCESTTIRYGFRDVCIRDAQLLVNGEPVLIKGVDRHELSPYHGYNVTREEMIRDIKVFKQLNVNAVRTCHYPDDPMWYDLCDEYGIYVLDEGNIETHGMGYDPDKTLANREDFLAAHLERDRRMVLRDYNHPSVIIWSLGNEAGDGSNFAACYKWIKEFDPSRPVHYERAEGGANTDIVCPMYATPAWCESYCQNNPAKPLIQCEYAHAMGNSMGNFKEYWDLVRKYPAYQGGFIWDFQDQALLWPSKEEGTDHIFAFGGDFNEYDPSDGSFNCNGVVAADRSFHPHAYEVRYQYQDIHTSLVSASGNYEVSVYNEFFFKDLSEYALEWNVEVDGSRLAGGTVRDLSVAPQKSAQLTLGKAVRLPKGADAFLNVKYVLKRAQPLMEAGEQVAYDQFVLSRAEMAVEAPEEFAREAKAEGGLASYAGTFGAHRWKAVFNASTGALSSYEIDGRQMLSDPLMPCFWRAVVENDMGAKLNEKWDVWRSPGFKVKSFEPTRDGVRVEYGPFGGAAVVMEYIIGEDGRIFIKESLKDAGSLKDMPPMFRFGMRFSMPGNYSTVDFFGKGPWENYEDRCSAALEGHYVQRVEDQYHYGYVRTQESGTHTGLRWFKVTDDAGLGLEITAEKRFSASAIPFSIEELDCTWNGTPKRANKTNNQVGAPQHSLSMKAKAFENQRSKGKTYVIFEAKQTGVGGINSWGRWPLDEYVLKAEERQFTYLITPVTGD